VSRETLRVAAIPFKSSVLKSVTEHIWHENVRIIIARPIKNTGHSFDPELFGVPVFPFSQLWRLKEKGPAQEDYVDRPFALHRLSEHPEYMGLQNMKDPTEGNDLF
jgi:hypothetical protein